MGIFDFLRKKIEELKSEKQEIIEKEPEIKLELISEKLEEWLVNKKEDNRRKEDNVIKEIMALVYELIDELKEENKELGTVDLKNRKEEQRIKNIVLENLANYSSYVNKLVENLEGLEKENLQKLVNDINKIFLEFKQKSNPSFEKATFLVGRQLEIVKESIRSFFDKVKYIEEQNKNIFQNSSIISLIGKKIEERKRFDYSKMEIIKEEKEIEKRILRKETEEKILEENIKKIKNSEEYTEWEKRRQESGLKKREIEKEIFEVKNMINWKNLSKIFHTNEKKMALVKDYECHFSQILEKDEEEKIIELLKEANIETGDISGRITDIRKKMGEVHKIINSKDRLSEPASEIMSIRTDIKNLFIEKEKILKRLQKIDENIVEIKSNISEELKKLGISIKG
jgi:hypothetical protein